jgi:hypothetical protein
MEEFGIIKDVIVDIENSNIVNIHAERLTLME